VAPAASCRGARRQARPRRDSTTERLAQCLDPRHLVDRGPDDREVEAIDGTNIAVEHLAEMEREINRGGRLSRLDSRLVEAVETAHLWTERYDA
jgi:hypothetical protein